MEYSVSTLKTNTIRAATGTTVNVASGQTFKANTIAGTTTAGSILVTGEGNSTTTNLQQGLAKVLASLDTSGTAEIDNSFNLTSITDNGTGDHTLTIANNLGSAFSYCSFMCAANASFDDECMAHIISRAVGTARFGITDVHNSADAFDVDPCMFIIHGDLA